jgi:hypothetical protein
MLNVVVFGSAADPDTRDRARDVDVAYRGDRDAAARLAAAWAEGQGIGGIPLDLHESEPSADGSVTIPVPCTAPAPYVALTPDTIVRVRMYRTLASYVRAYGHDPARLAIELPDWERLTVIPVEQDGPDWEGYVSGLGALRRAIAKTPDPGATVDVLRKDYGPLLARLIDEDPRPDEDGLETLRGASPVAAGGAVIIVLLRGHVPRLQYGGIAPERLEALLYG